MGAAHGPTDSFFEGDDLPITPSGVDIGVFLKKANEGSLSEQETLRLPTEAEWEYAARAGTTGQFSFDGRPEHSLMNFNDGQIKSAVVVEGKLDVEWITPPDPNCRMATAPVGSLPPNPWGLHEMHGNDWEWTSDRYLPEGHPSQPAAPNEVRALRGGSWYDNANDCRSAVRDLAGPAVHSNRIGFRVARSAEAPSYPESRSTPSSRVPVIVPK